MLVGQCSSQLSGHQNDERNQKVTTSDWSKAEPRDLQFNGTFLETQNPTAERFVKQEGPFCCFLPIP
jgi:hypothetical protein